MFASNAPTGANQASLTSNYVRSMLAHVEAFGSFVSSVDCL